MKKSRLLLVPLLLAGFIWIQGPKAKEGCDLSDTTADRPHNKNTASYTNTWYTNPEKTLWAGHGGKWFAGDNKVLWERPVNEQLKVTGRRLDGDAPPLEAHIPDGYPDDYQASGLLFPTGGCWEISAQAGKETISFIVGVMPRSLATPSRSCYPLEDAAQKSDAIMIARVVGRVDAVDTFAWYTIQPEKILKGKAESWIEFLHDDLAEAPIEIGKTYAIFLAMEPGYSTGLVCGFAPLAEVESENLKVKDGELFGTKISSLAELEKMISAQK